MRGTFTALATPFTQEGKVNFEALKKNLLHQKESGVDGVVILGSTGEASTITRDEKIAIIKAAKETLGSTHLMVGTGSYSTKDTCEMTEIAFNLGADSVLVVAPYYNKPPQEGLIKHFRSAAKIGPTVVYNIPGRCSVNIENATMLKILEEENVIGVKESTGNIAEAGDLIVRAKEMRPEVSIFAGDDSSILPIIALGGDGIISVASNIVPKEIRKMTLAAMQGDFETARTYNRSLLPLIKALFVMTNPIPLKALMNHLGLEAGPVRAPLVDMTDTNPLIRAWNQYDQKLERELSFPRNRT